MIRIFIIFCFLTLYLSINSSAQSQATFTNGNTILVTIEGTAGLYEYTSNQLLVRYNEKTKKMECIVNINTLLPANNFSPVVLPQDIFFTAKYPEVLIEIDAPEEHVQKGLPPAQGTNRGAIIYFQGMPIERNIPVVFAPDLQSRIFSTNFDLFLPDYQITVPAKYIPMLTGRIKFAIMNAQWVVLGPR